MEYNTDNQPSAMSSGMYGNQGNGGYGQSYGQGYGQGFASGYAQQQEQYNYTDNNQQTHHQQNYNQGHQNYNQGNQGFQGNGYNNRGRGGMNFPSGRRPPFQKKQFKKKPATNIQENLRKFSAVQQVTLLAPDAEIDVQPALAEKNCALWKGTATYQGRTIEAFQVGKKKTRQAVCSKLVKEFKLLDQMFGHGTSENFSVGMHTEEVTEETMEEMRENSAKVAAKKAAKIAQAADPETGIEQMSEDQLLNEPAMEPENGTPTDAPTEAVAPAPTTPKTGVKPAKTPISVLSKQYAKDQKPKYECLQPETINAGFEATVELFCGTTFTGIGRGKKTAQHHAAFQALESLFPAELEGLALPVGAGTKEHPVQATKSQ